MSLIKKFINFLKGKNIMNTKNVSVGNRYTSIHNTQMRSLMKQRTIECKEFVRKLDPYSHYVVTKNYSGLVIAGADEEYKRRSSFTKFNTDGFKKLLSKEQRSVRIKSVPRMDAEHILFIMRNTPVKNRNGKNSNEPIKATVE